MNINKVTELTGKTVTVDGFTVTIKEVIFGQAIWLMFDKPVDRGNPSLSKDWQSISIWDQSDADRVQELDPVMDSIWANEAPIAA